MSERLPDEIAMTKFERAVVEELKYIREALEDIAKTLKESERL